MTFETVSWQIGTAIAGAVLTALLMAVGHWFPWPYPIVRIQRYTYGTTFILLGFSLWRLLNGDWITPAGLLGISIAGGATVVLPTRQTNTSWNYAKPTRPPQPMMS